jgi:hypothetical protein
MSRLQRHVGSSHRGVVVDDDAKVYSCKTCDYSSARKRLLLLHEKRTHFCARTCEKCGAVLASFKTFLEHKKLHDRVDVRRHRCPENGCLYAAKTAYDLKSHLLSHKGDRARLKCDQCDLFSCRRQSELNRHVMNKHSTMARFRCEMCEYSCNSRQHLQRHSATHGEQQRTVFQCRYDCCDYVSHSMDSLRKHILKTARHPNASVYSCDYCHFATNEFRDFRGHASRQHPDVFASALDAARYLKNYFAVKT